MLTTAITEARRRVYTDAMGRLPNDSQRDLFRRLIAIGAPDALQRFDPIDDEREAMRRDAQTLIAAARQLEYVITQIYEEPFPELPVADGKIIPFDTSVPEGAETFVYYVYSGAALARFSAAYSTGTAPRAAISAASVPGKVEGMEGSYGYHARELRAAAFAGVPLDAMLAKFERRAHAELLQRTLLFGREDLGLPGFLTHPNITVIDPPADGTGSSRLWSTKTVEQIARDYSTLVRTLERTSFGMRKTTHVLLPRDEEIRLSTTRLGAGDGGMTILDFLRKAHPGIEIGVLNELSASMSGGVLTTDAAVAYVKDPAIMSAVVPMPFRQHPPQLHNLEVVVPCESSTGGMRIVEPQTIVRMDGIGQS